MSELKIPERAALVGISIQDKSKPHFILGKGKKALERLETVPSPEAAKGGENFVYLILRGVRAEDVQWGPKDIEDFWIGTLSDDGTQILEWQPLSEMVLEPSGQLDKP